MHATTLDNINLFDADIGQRALVWFSQHPIMG
jgi:hypothetical protein